MASAFAIVVSGASVTWLGCAYATAVLWTLLLQSGGAAAAVGAAAPLGVRGDRRAVRRGRAPPSMLIHADAGAVGATATMLSAAALLGCGRSRSKPTPPTPTPRTCSSSSPFSARRSRAVPGSILVPVRNPHLLAHLMAALRAPREPRSS